jgi:glycosyltransferase involved in cell wall biosynthesis
MKIAINTLSITPLRAGAKTYITNLIKNIAEIDNTNTYFLILSKMNQHLFQINRKNFNKIVLPLATDNKLLRVFMEQFLIPFYIKKNKIDVLFSPGNVITIFSGCKKIITINDMAYKEIHSGLPKKRVLYYNIFLPLSVRRTDYIITISNYTKSALTKEFKKAENKIKVIHHGIDSKDFFVHNIKRRHKLDGLEHFIFFLGTLHKHKNADRLIEAFAILKSKYKIPHKLIIAGRDPGGKIKELNGIVESHSMKKEVILTDRLDHEDIVIYFHNADIFVFPSAYEGFGIPVLEAMACGTPIVASDRTAIPEIVDDAGILVNPDNIEDIAEAVHKVLTDEELRKKLIKKGFQRVKKFSWKSAAKNTIEVFEDLKNDRDEA